MISNKNMPAMPQHVSINDSGDCETSDRAGGEGLTKREMFAMNAPDIPNWFIDEWIYNDGNYRLGGGHELVGNNRGANLDTTEMMKITKEWRYAYADLMLEE